MPVWDRTESISSGVAVGALDLSRAQAPATWGAAMEVPLKVSKPSPGTEVRIPSPGASRSSWGELFEKLETDSGTAPMPMPLTEPTLTTPEMQPGKSIVLRDPPLPEVPTGAIPAARRLSMAALTAGKSPSQLSGSGAGAPKLMLTAATSKLEPSSRTRSIPASQSLVVELMQSSPHCENTLMAMMRASWATPENSAPYPAATPATAVP